MGPGDQQSYVTEEQRSAMLISSPPVTLPVQTTFTSSPTAPTVPSRETHGALILAVHAFASFVCGP